MGVKKASYVSLIGVALMLTACTDSEIQKVPPMTMEEVAGTRLAQLTNDEKEGLIYKYVSDRITVDKDRLLAVEANDKKAITKVMTAVNQNLHGMDNKALSDEYINYMLSEFARTPYEWDQSNVSVVGFDPASRLYFVDVTYKTTGSYKSVVPASKIPNGSPDEDAMKEKRYTDYVAYLTYNASGNAVSASQSLAAFKTAWGEPSAVMEEQQGVSLADRTKALAAQAGGIGKLTYPGLIEDPKMNGSATMTFRFVLKYKFNLGEETDLQVNSLYLKDFKLDNQDALLKSYSQGNDTAMEVLKPFIDKTIISYHKALEESNNQGLYNLFVNYGGIDKYYDDLHNYSYNSIGGYNFKILSRSGKNVVVEVNRINKIRAKGANMSLPTYDETLIYNLTLANDDTIKIQNINLVSSTLAGEPLSVIKNVSGISDLIQYSGESFTDTNKTAVENAIKQFSKVVFDAKVNSEEFTNIVDIGVSQTTLAKMSDVITAIPDATRKTNYIVSWDTKTNVYVSLTLREVFETPSGNYDTESVVDLVNRNNEWKVVNYTRTLNIKTSTTTLNVKNALSEDTR